MKARCYNKKTPHYFRYGGRGIYICERWISSLENFVLDMGKRPSDRHSIDRIDNNGNYEPSNCRWATPEEQGVNKRSNANITYNGKTQTLTQWAREMDLKTHTLRKRIFELGWDLDVAMSSRPIKSFKLDPEKVLEIRALLHDRVPIIEIARRFGIDQKLVYNIKNGLVWKHVNQIKV